MPTTVRKLKANVTSTKATTPTPPTKAVTTKPAARAAAAAAPAKTKPVAPAPQKPVAVPEPEPVEIEQDQEIVYEETIESIPEAVSESDSDEDLLRTPTVKLPPPNPTAHIATITGFERNDFDSGAVSATFKLEFEDNQKEDNFKIWLPSVFVEHFAEVMANPESTLPNEEGDKANGVKGNMQLNRYLRDIANGDRNATMQKVMRIAASQGHTRAELGIEAVPDSIDSWFEILGAVLVGVRAIALCRPDRNVDDPQFASMLRVQSLVDPAVLDDEKQKVLRRFDGKKGYVFAWE